MSKNNVIEVRNVSKKFKDVTVLDEVSLCVKQGTICGLVGMNGSGKTLLMKTICGFLRPDFGVVIVDGKQIGKDCDFPENTGVIIENPGFSQYLSGFRNLKNLSSINKKISSEEIREAMTLVGLNPDDKKWVSKYSLGMRQRLGIAQAVMEHQGILILDEPMNGLDKHGVEDIRALLLKFRDDGKTVVLSSHNKEDISILCDVVYEMDGGKLQEFSK